MSATSISDIYDNLNTLIASALTGYNRIPNPYEPDENPSLYKKKGYGVAYGSGVNSFRTICDKVSIRRDFNVVLINQVLAPQINAATRGGFEKSILEDHWLVINAARQDNTLSGEALNVQYVTDSGIRYAESETEKFLVIESVFEIEYLETLV